MNLEKFKTEHEELLKTFHEEGPFDLTDKEIRLLTKFFFRLFRNGPMPSAYGSYEALIHEKNFRDSAAGIKSASRLGKIAIAVGIATLIAALAPLILA